MIRRFSPPRRVPLLLAALVIGLLGAAIAYALTVDVVAQGTLANYPPFNGPANVGTFKYVIDPGEAVPWHYHTGAGYGIIQQGTLTETKGCGEGSESYPTGTVLQEEANHIHMATNEGADPVVIYWTEIWPVGQADTVFVDGPNCAPTTPEECKEGGWRNFPSLGFHNQGECVSYVEKRRKNRG